MPNTSPAKTINQLIELLTLERVDATTYRGRPEDPGWGRLYGGHVYAQALAAASATVPEGRAVHSHQGTFLLAGDVDAPLTYVVDIARDGASFSSRRVAAYQNEKMIFHATTSFQAPAEGYEHQDAMPDVPAPEAIPSEAEAVADWAHRLPEKVREALVTPGAFELRLSPALDDPIAPTPHPPDRNVWLRGVGAIADTPSLHAMLLAYASDYLLLTTAMLPHGASWLNPGMHVATLNHSLWFHAPFRADDWLLHTMHSPRASGARALAQGSLYTRAGLLVASSMQEGLIRPGRKR